MKCETRQYYYDYKSGKYRYDTGIFFEQLDGIVSNIMKALELMGIERHENAQCIYYDRADIRDQFTRYIYYK